MIRCEKCHKIFSPEYYRQTVCYDCQEQEEWERFEEDKFNWEDDD